MDNLNLNRLGVAQNLGLFDRIARLVLGWSLLGYAAFDLMFGGATASWHGFAMIIAIYPLMTGMLGQDPLYALIHARSCDTQGRNQCGTMPFEIAAALGKHPTCSSDYDCHLQLGRHDDHRGATA